MSTTSSSLQQAVHTTFAEMSPQQCRPSVHRIQLAELCEETVNRFPFALDPTMRDYDDVLALDTKFHEYLRQLPEFFQLDPASIQQTQEICQEKPYIAWQRLILHFSTHTRLCWLHWSFHVDRSTDYAYSHQACLHTPRPHGARSA